MGLAAGLALGVSACATAGPPPEQRETERLAARFGPREAVARAWTRAREADDPATRAAWLAAAWGARASLLDDRLLRELLAPLPEPAVPGPLRAAWLVEQARIALQSGATSASRHLTDAALRASEATASQPSQRAGWTRARATLLAASLAEPSVAELLLGGVGRARPAGAPGRHLVARARMLAAGLAHGAERYKEAIAGYLTLGPESGQYRASRLGLAWCQIRVGRPERALEVLALLPGGLAGDPERAVPAAMSAHMLGHVDGARAVVAKALGLRARWDPARATPEAVLQLVHSQGASVLLRDPDDDIVETLARSAELSLLGGELLAARAELSPVSAPYLAQLEKAWAHAVAAAAERQRARVDEAYRDLTTLEPQLVPLE